MTNLQAALISVAATFIGVYVGHLLSAQSMRKMPVQVLSLLIERGLITQGRESEARGLVAERYFSGGYRRIIPPFVYGQSELPQGLKFPIDVSGKQALGPENKFSSAYTFTQEMGSEGISGGKKMWLVHESPTIQP